MLKLNYINNLIFDFYQFYFNLFKMTTPFISDLAGLISLTNVPAPGADLHTIIQINNFSQITTVYLAPEKMGVPIFPKRVSALTLSRI